MTVQNKLKKIALYLLAFVALCICGIAVAALLELFWDFNQHFVHVGLNCGFIAWVVMFIVPFLKKKKS